VRTLAQVKISPAQIDAPPYIVRFFQRLYRYCNTVAQLNKALITLEKRLTPLEAECLRDWHLNDQLLPPGATVKFQKAFTHWIQNMKRMMLDSGKQQPEPFVLHRIAPTVTHFVGSGSPANKTLLLCFSARGGGRLMMPNAILMQHTNADRYDLMIISEPLREGYRLGVPSLGKNVTEVIESIARLDSVGEYSRIRTLGCSAGGYPAVIAGYLLGAEMAVSVSGRFPSERYPLRILNMVYTTWQAKRKGSCSCVLMSYAADKTRDRSYNRVIAGLCGGSMIGVEFTNGKVGHRILRRLVERGELASYLSRTIFADQDDALIATERESVVMSFPSTQIRPYN